MPPIIAAARARATEGEMIAAMQEVFGTYTESPGLLVPASPHDWSLRPPIGVVKGSAELVPLPWARATALRRSFRTCAGSYFICQWEKRSGHRPVARWV